MAMDRRDDRASAIGVSLPLRVWPTPSGVLNSASDRMHMAYLYRILVDPKHKSKGRLLLMGVGR